MKYAKAIKLLREKMLVSQSELAKMLGTTQVSVHRQETWQFEPSFKAKRQLKSILLNTKLILKNKEFYE